MFMIRYERHKWIKIKQTKTQHVGFLRASQVTFINSDHIFPENVKKTV